MKKSRDKKKIYILIVTVILFISAIIYTYNSLSNERNLNFFERTIKDTATFISDTLYAPIKYVRNKLEIYHEKELIYEKYRKIKEDADDINQKKVRIAELEKENAALKDSLKIDYSLLDYSTINATVISRDTGHWFNKLVVNKGKKDGIEQHMAVVVNDGLIGYISEVSNHSSNVQLLTTTSLKNKISVKITLDDGTTINGLLSGYDEKQKVYTIEGISYSGEIPKNAYVTTTGLSENFPSGILIGYVKNITTDNFDLGKIVEAKPSVNFNDIQYVTVLKRMAPTE